MTNPPPESSTLTFQPLSLVVAAWDRDRVTPGAKHFLGVTLTNRGEQDAVVQVRLESPSDLLQQWCPQPEQWLALSSGKSGELTFCIEVPADALPQWFDYEVVARPQGNYSDCYLPPTRCRLQILAPETTATTQDPTFTLTPITTPDRPLIVQPGTPTTVELIVENRSERVDRFRLECTGLPDDWRVQVEYPREFGGLGLVQLADSVGVNPGDRGNARVIILPPALPLAGSYLPTFRLSSENDTNLGLLSLVYLQVNPVYQLQSQLQLVQEQVRDRPAQFLVQFANLGNTPRQVQVRLTPLTPVGSCTYSLPTDTLAIAPQTTAQLPIEGQPRRWWTRPWLGSGKIYPFRLDFTDPELHPVLPPTLQGYLTWMPRPWWQLLLALLAGLGLLGALIFLIWWVFLRPPTPPEVLEFAAEDSRYAEVNGDMVRVRWQIEHPEQIRTLKLTGYSAAGDILSGPLVYDFSDGKLPAALQPFCTQQKHLLSCNQVRTDAFQPGKYVFELTLEPKRRRAKPLFFKTNPVEIAAKPFPTVTALVAKSLVYREAGFGNPTPAEKAIPVADRAGVRLDWAVTMPQDVTALHLVGRDKDGKMVGDLLFSFPAPGQLPEALQPYCKVGPLLICRNVPTGLNMVGEYRLELQAIATGQPDNPDNKPKATEVIKIQPQTAQILNFQINGQEAPAKLLLAVPAGKLPAPIQVRWRVQGGSTTRVELNPTPGSVPLSGQLNLPLSPQGSTTLTLQVKPATGDPVLRSVTIEVFNPAQPSPSGDGDTGTDTPGAAGSPTTTGGGAGTAGTPSPIPIGVPSPAVDDRLSPAEQPPQFNDGK